MGFLYMNFDEYMTNDRSAAWLENRTEEAWFNKVVPCITQSDREEDASRACFQVSVCGDKKMHRYMLLF